MVFSRPRLNTVQTETARPHFFELLENNVCVIINFEAKVPQVNPKSSIVVDLLCNLPLQHLATGKGTEFTNTIDASTCQLGTYKLDRFRKVFIHNNYKNIFPPTKITIYSERDMIIIKPSRIQKNSEDLNINSLKACIIIRRIIIIQIKQ